jgi:hypothetical protein
MKVETMKKNKTNNKTTSLPSRHPVHIEFNHATASAISIAGTFNDWRPGVTPMVSLGDGRWCKQLVLKPGAYEYRLVVDGEWLPDPHANETTPNPFGGMNSILKVNGG